MYLVLAILDLKYLCVILFHISSSLNNTCIGKYGSAHSKHEVTFCGQKHSRDNIYRNILDHLYLNAFKILYLAIMQKTDMPMTFMTCINCVNP